MLQSWGVERVLSYRIEKMGNKGECVSIYDKILTVSNVLLCTLLLPEGCDAELPF